MTEKPIEVFFSYSHQDEAFKDELVKHLSILQRQGIISGWHDRLIKPGSEWDREIDTHLNSADIILLMVSADFLASDYCWGIEVQKAMRRHEAGEARVIPVVLRRVVWDGAPFAKLQALPKNRDPIASWSDRDDAFYDVARGIAVAVDELQKVQQQQEAERQAVERARLEVEECKRQVELQRQADEEKAKLAEKEQKRQEEERQEKLRQQAEEKVRLNERKREDEERQTGERVTYEAEKQQAGLPQQVEEQERESEALQIVSSLGQALWTILFPPLAVFSLVGFKIPFWLNIGLTLIGWVPGIIHAVWIWSVRKPEAIYRNVLSAAITIAILGIFLLGVIFQSSSTV